MFWRFGFSSTSTLDSLLEKSNVTLEEVLDEDDLLSECKAQNQKLIAYLQQKRVLKRLLEHVVGTARLRGTGGKDWEEKVKFKYPYIASEVLSSDIWAISEALTSSPEEFLAPFWDAVLTSRPTPSQAPLPIHSHPLFSDSAPKSPLLGVTNVGESSGSSSESESADGPGPRAFTALDNGPGRSVLAGYWAKVNGVLLERKPREMLTFIQGLPRIVERFVAHLETPAVVDLLFRIIQTEESLPNAGVISWLSADELIPRAVDLLAPNYSVDLHNTVSELLKAIIALAAPSPASLNQGQGMEAGDQFGQQNVGGINNRLVRELASEPIVRKMVGFMLDAQLPQQLTRRLTDVADEQLAQLALDDGSGSKFRKPSTLGAPTAGLSTLSETPTTPDQESALEDEDDDSGFIRPLNPREFPASESQSRSPGAGAHEHRDSTATVRPSNFFPPVSAPTVQVTKETTNSSLVTCISVFIELIRKNNSDYFEQHLFHTLRTHLLQRQQELSEKRAMRQSDASATSTDDKDQSGSANQNEAVENNEDDDEEMEGMEEAMAEMADKLGIVHLGPMLQILADRLQDFQGIVTKPRTDEPLMNSTVGEIVPLTFERYRITELYAELLHCSNMALLNRAPGEGPQYSPDGTLMGGIEGLQVLARTLQGGDGPEVNDTSRVVESHAEGDEASMEVDAAAGNDAATKPEAEAQAEEAMPATVTATADSTEAMDEDGATSAGTPAVDATGETATETSGSARSSHIREKSSTHHVGGTASEDTEDEALLNEVSLSDKQPEASSETPAAAEAEAEAEAAVDSTSTTQEAPATDAAATTSDAAQAKGDDDDDGGDQDAKSIISALSGMSLAELTTPQPSGPPSPIDDSREYVVGDLLKKKFLECSIIPSLLDLFFKYPWNNFLHNVVYDILQQFFNGRMDVGLNRKLTMAVFEQGHLTQRIIEGHARNVESMKGPRRIRLGYMGHMNLIAEETVKLLERYPLEVARPISKSLEQPAWDDFVNQTLRENREREAGPLAGGRPTAGASMSFGADDDDEQDRVGAGSSSFASYLSSQIGGAAGTSDDDDSDEEQSWLSHGIHSGARSSGFEDAFAPNGGSDDQDDEWGPFADPADGDPNKTSFDFPSTSTSAAGNPFAQNLTPADWSAQFRREGTPDAPFVDDDDSSSSNGSSSGGDNDGTGANRDGDTPFVDLLDPSTLRRTDVVAQTHARRPSLGQLEASSLPPVEPRRRGSSASSGSSEPIALQATDGESPLGPGVPADIEQRDDGMLQRTLEDGTVVVVPLDEVALASEEGQSERRTSSEESGATAAADEAAASH
ncbi:uncharacterized protein PFL1_05578 [Pseudozyma flocculosa PF-1]|uniref:Related to SAP155 - SIT4-associating protein n=2 Tax=Pseudozyma flocculosa TaxID=84751 RepID=A0A5C3FBW0_9BASI|nr:uncharacterized protein PFL1_05578 [Pseudozyma flocculosa PF-1]EPQ26944.1 hypothetical protein PFL1_05578 [Pseudozyma flocculosa PF-1]SPO41147.1 related to SAP155 - SIT4-associating protein [Pseudozyma flocculosa]